LNQPLRQALPRCFTIATAATEAVGNPQVRAFLAETVRGLDAAFEACIRFARDLGELKPDADPAAWPSSPRRSCTRLPSARGPESRAPRWKPPPRRA
jgi:hypothetical protein